MEEKEIALESRLEGLANLVVKHKKQRRLKDLEEAWRLAEESLAWLKRARERSKPKLFELRE